MSYFIHRAQHSIWLHEKMEKKGEEEEVRHGGGRVMLRQGQCVCPLKSAPISVVTRLS